MNALIAQPLTNADLYRASSDAAGLCRDIVVNTAKKIGDRKFVQVEGWQAIAIAHGCAASAREVEKIDGGVRAIGEVRRMSDGALIAQAEGFVGEDEATWFGGEQISYGKKKVLPKRPDYAIRAMAQTRAISRACRSAFAHVVVMMNAGLSTTPAEEVPDGGFPDDFRSEPRNTTPRTQEDERPAAVVAAEAAIIMLRTIEECDEWAASNGAGFDKLPTAQGKAIRKKFDEHRASLLPLHPNARAHKATADADFRAEELEDAFQ
ncbi:MAG: hypothetical protein J7521_20175 [Caulobacter sp.]|nr:hypothetical protein [Caulobacter sp.]